MKKSIVRGQYAKRREHGAKSEKFKARGSWSAVLDS